MAELTTDPTAPPAPTAPAVDLAAQITAMVASITDLDPADLTAESRFEDIEDWSSLKALALMVDVEQDLPIKLDLRRFMAVRTLGELNALIAVGLGQAADTAG
jgi:acyl carrier protein